MQETVNAPHAGEGDRVHGMISALVSAGLDGGYLANPQLKPTPRYTRKGAGTRSRAGVAASWPRTYQVRRPRLYPFDG